MAATRSSVAGGPTPRARSRIARPAGVIPFDDAAARVFAPLKAMLASKGELIGPMDLLIAATARTHGATVVTNNTREFSRVRGLAVEHWSR